MSWLDAVIADRCTWHCVRARELICICRCGGRYHGDYEQELAACRARRAMAELPIEQALEASR